MQAQTPEAPGHWKCYLPYGGNVSVAAGNDMVYTANASTVYSLDGSDNSYSLLNKATGLSDIGATKIYYGEQQKTAVISYLNYDIDFIVDGKIENFSAVKESTIPGDKALYSATFYGDTIFLSCGFGIVLYSVKNNNSPTSYSFKTDGEYFAVNDCAVYGNILYAATDEGIYTGTMGDFLEDFSKWENISGVAPSLPAGPVRFAETVGDKLYAVISDSLLYMYDGSTWSLNMQEAGFRFRSMTEGNGELILVSYAGTDDAPTESKIISIAADGSSTVVEDAENLSVPFDADLDDDGILWIADPYRGLIKYENSIFTSFIPNGPLSPAVFDLEYYDNTLWVAPGEVNASWTYLFNHEGFFEMNYGVWNNVNSYGYSQLTDIYDLITVTIDAHTGKTYFGSFGGGIVEYDKATGAMQIYDETTPGTSLQSAIGQEGSCRIGGLQFDVDGNLWISNTNSGNALSVLTADGQWKGFTLPLPATAGNQSAQIAVDDLNQKWVQIARGTGIVVVNTGEDVMDGSDDQMKLLSTGAGNGNLPTGYVYCIVKDKDGEMWVGTSEGISIFYNAGEVFSGTSSGDASQPLVDLGGYNEYLLSKEIVNCIAVDGANRKWVGTNSGAFLISEDGTQQLKFFNETNSPLLSNSVIAITIDGKTGEVFFGTSKGIVSYRGDATDGQAEHTDVSVFPNPVRENYAGNIFISGLVENAQVKIVDAAGRLVYETTALGGQAVWNGKGYEGRRAATGVYLVFSSNDDGSETYVAKFLMVN